jgi:hypothetical protein
MKRQSSEARKGGPISLFPLKLKDALRGAMKVPVKQKPRTKSAAKK